MPLHYPIPQQIAGPPDALQVLMFIRSCKEKLFAFLSTLFPFFLYA